MFGFCTGRKRFSIVRQRLALGDAQDTSLVRCGKNLDHANWREQLRAVLFPKDGPAKRDFRLNISPTYLHAVGSPEFQPGGRPTSVKSGVPGQSPQGDDTSSPALSAQELIDGPRVKAFGL